jgi:hypothetical protein
VEKASSAMPTQRRFSVARLDMNQTHKNMEEHTRWRGQLWEPARDDKKERQGGQILYMDYYYLVRQHEFDNSEHKSEMKISCRRYDINVSAAITLYNL